MRSDPSEIFSNISIDTPHTLLFQTHSSSQRPNDKKKVSIFLRPPLPFLFLTIIYVNYYHFLPRHRHRTTQSTHLGSFHQPSESFCLSPCMSRIFVAQRTASTFASCPVLQLYSTSIRMIGVRLKYIRVLYISPQNVIQPSMFMLKPKRVDLMGLNIREVGQSLFERLSWTPFKIK